MIILGVMSGSSLDGFDLAVCSFSNDPDFEWEILCSKSYPISSSLKSSLHTVFELGVENLFHCDRKFNDELCKAIKDLETTYGYNFEAIATHGHTVLHLPNSGVSFQLGNGGALAALTNKKVIADFRIQDVAIGGVGTPLIPIAERDLFRGYDFYLNLGGIANMSFFDKGISAYDICPCNQVLNYLAGNRNLPYDEDGRLARLGSIKEEKLELWLNQDYFQKADPKSLDNNWIKREWIPFLNQSDLETNDFLATYVELIAKLVAHAVGNSDKSRRLFISGGGTKNKYLLERISIHLDQKGVSVTIPSIEIIDFKEAILMAYLGYLRLNEKVNILNEVTGANRKFSAGAVYLPPQ